MNNGGGIGSQLVGGIFVTALGVLVIAGIYQLNKPNTPLVPGATSVANNTLSSIFK